MLNKARSDYLILGNSTAAVSAIEAIRKTDPQGSITLVSSEPYHTYARPLISYYLSGQIKEAQLPYRPLDFYKRNNVTTLLGVKGVGLDEQNRQVFLEPAGSEAPPILYDAWQRNPKSINEVVGYNKLLLATGSRPAVPPLEGVYQPGVHYFYTLDDILGLKADLKPEKSPKSSPESSPERSAVVLGAGLIGMKAAEALNKQGCRVTVVEMASRVMNLILDETAALIIQNLFEEHGVDFKLAARAAKILGEERVSGIELADGSRISCDLLIIAAGVRPNYEIIQNTAIKYGQGILVNEHQETSVPGIYCAGDVCEGFDLLQEQTKLTPILPNAFQQGQVAGRNMAGNYDIYSGSLAFNSTTFFGLPLVTMGLSQASGEEFSGFEAVQGRDYRSLIFKEGCLKGAILINQTERAGILKGLIRQKTAVFTQKDKLLQAAPRLIDLNISI